MIKVDFHTHSSASPDGGISPEQYAKALSDGQLDCIAITDHNSVDLAQSLHKSLGDQIIVGEEIMTSEGELIGLFLHSFVMPHQTAEATAKSIKAQGGIVYVPHPLETVRKGLPKSVLDSIAELVDVVEVHNGRAVFQNRGPQAATWARLNRKEIAASSDAHGHKGLGSAYTQISEQPTASNIVKLLKTARFVTNRPPLKALLYPKLHRLRKKFGVNK